MRGFCLQSWATCVLPYFLPKSPKIDFTSHYNLALTVTEIHRLRLSIWGIAEMRVVRKAEIDTEPFAIQCARCIGLSTGNMLIMMIFLQVCTFANRQLDSWHPVRRLWIVCLSHQITLRPLEERNMISLVWPKVDSDPQSSIQALPFSF